VPVEEHQERDCNEGNKAQEEGDEMEIILLHHRVC
jgi:hypothetical protein